MKTIALIVFTLSTFVFALGFPIIFIVNMSGPGKVATLDRAGVINEEILKRDFPALAQNTRYNVGYYITESHDTTLRFFISFGFVASLFGLIQAIRNRKTPNQSLETTPMAVTPAASHPSRHPQARLT